MRSLKEMFFCYVREEAQGIEQSLAENRVLENGKLRVANENRTRMWQCVRIVNAEESML